MAEKIGGIEIEVSAAADTERKMDESGRKAAKGWADSFIRNLNRDVKREQSGLLKMFGSSLGGMKEKLLDTSIGTKLFGRQTYNIQNEPAGRQGGLLSSMMYGKRTGTDAQDQKQGGILGGISSMGKSLVKMLAVFGFVALGIEGIWKGVKMLVSNTIGSSGFLRSIFRILFIAMALFFKPFGDFLGALLRPLAMWLIKMAKDFTSRIMPLTQKLIGGEIGPMEFLGGVVKELMPDLEAIGEKIKEGLEGIVPILSEVWGAIRPIFETVWNDVVKPILTTAWNIFVEKFPALWAAVEPLLLSAWKLLVDFITKPEVVNGIIKFVSTIFSTLLDKAPGVVLTIIKSLGSNFGDNILGGILGIVIGVLIAAATAATGGLALAIIAALGVLGAAIYPMILAAIEYGLNVLSGFGNWLWDKITSKLGFGGSEKRAIGGPVSAGEIYTVGERGPELFVPSTSGSIVPNNKLGGMGGNNFNISVSIQASKIDQSNLDSLARQVGEKIYEDVRRRVTF